jgi:hypothetical protein
MAEEPATITYSIAEPFQKALQIVRRVLSARDLKITGELNISGRIWQRLRVGTAPCVVLFVWPSATLGKTLGSDSCATALAPLHVVVSGRGSHSEVHVLRALPSDAGQLNRRAMAAWNHLQDEVLQAIEKIGMRVTLSV